MGTVTTTTKLTPKQRAYVTAYQRLRALQANQQELVVAADRALLEIAGGADDPDRHGAAWCEKTFAGTPAAASKTTFGKKLNRIRTGAPRDRGGAGQPKKQKTD